jgi:membrane associated rhomboid family serine protease
MTPTSVGMRCPECSRDRTKVRTIRSLPSSPVATQALIAINVIVFLAEVATGSSLGGTVAGTVYEKGALYGPAIVDQHQYWRLVSAGFLHDGLWHIVINMFSLYFVGAALEPAIGRVNFVAIYVASLLAGSFGALLFAPDVPTLGASGAIFGIFGALIVVARNRGIPLWQSGLGVVLLINLLFSFSFKGISVGAHLGGLLAGVIAGVVVLELSERRRLPAIALASCLVIAAGSVVGAIAVAGGPGLVPHGIGFVGS